MIHITFSRYHLRYQLQSAQLVGVQLLNAQKLYRQLLLQLLRQLQQQLPRDPCQSDDRSLGSKLFCFHFYHCFTQKSSELWLTNFIDKFHNHSVIILYF